MTPAVQSFGFCALVKPGVQLLTVLARKGGVKKSKRGSVLMIELQTR
jgi:hypothetical protein